MPVDGFSCALNWLKCYISDLLLFRSTLSKIVLKFFFCNLNNSEKVFYFSAFHLVSICGKGFES